MRHIWRLLALSLLCAPFCNAQNGSNMINPNTQIRWPLSCTGPSGAGAYSPIANACFPYVNKTGDTMSGNLTIQPQGFASLTLHSTTGGSVLKLQDDGAAVDQQIWNLDSTSSGDFYLSAVSNSGAANNAIDCSRIGYNPGFCTFAGGVSTPMLKDSVLATGNLNDVPTARGDGTWIWQPQTGGGTGSGSCASCVQRVGDSMTGALTLNYQASPTVASVGSTASTINTKRSIFRGDWSPTICYDAGDVVSMPLSGSWESRASNNCGANPNGFPRWWGALRATTATAPLAAQTMFHTLSIVPSQPTSISTGANFATNIGAGSAGQNIGNNVGIQTNGAILSDAYYLNGYTGAPTAALGPNFAFIAPGTNFAGASPSYGSGVVAATRDAWYNTSTSAPSYNLWEELDASSVLANNATPAKITRTWQTFSNTTALPYEDWWQTPANSTYTMSSQFIPMGGVAFSSSQNIYALSSLRSIQAIFHDLGGHFATNYLAFNFWGVAQNNAVMVGNAGNCFGFTTAANCAPPANGNTFGTTGQTIIDGSGNLQIKGGLNVTALNTYATASITPTAVAANVCSDQNFTLTGVTAATIYWAVKPPAALGNISVQAISNAANSVTLHFCNPSVASVTPPAGVYTIPGVN